jgi:hypothetical protein
MSSAIRAVSPIFVERAIEDARRYQKLAVVITPVAKPKEAS